MATRDMVPIRSFLEALGVPSSAIQYDQQSGSVRVGDHTIQPETNLEGRTYAQPDVLRQAVQNLQGLLPQQSTGPAPSGGPITPPMNDQFALPDFGAATQNTLDILQQTTPQFEAIRQQMAPTSEQVARAVDIMGQTASGAPTLNAQTQVANMFNQLGQTLGLMPGQVPEMAGMFSDLLGQTTGQQTEQRRANMAQEAVARAAQALAERQFAWQQAVYADELARADAERAAGEFSLPDQIQYGLAAANAFLEANPDASFEDAAGIITGLMGEAITPQAAEQAIISLRNRRFPAAPAPTGLIDNLRSVAQQRVEDGALRTPLGTLFDSSGRSGGGPSASDLTSAGAVGGAALAGAHFARNAAMLPGMQSLAGAGAAASGAASAPLALPGQTPLALPAPAAPPPTPPPALSAGRVPAALPAPSSGGALPARATPMTPDVIRTGPVSSASPMSTRDFLEWVRRASQSGGIRTFLPNVVFPDQLDLLDYLLGDNVPSL